MNGANFGIDVERLPKKTVQTICDGVDTVLNTVCGV